MRETEVDCLDAVRVFLFVLGGAVRAADGVSRFEPQLALQRLDEGLEQIEHQSVGAAHHRAGLGVDQGVEHDWFDLVLSMRRVDRRNTGMRFVERIDEGHARLVHRQALKLGE